MNVIDWLLEGDPAIRWQVLQDLAGASPDVVATERARVEREGWGARLLALESPDGLWDGGACFPASYRGGEPGQPWTATMHTLQTLQILGLEPASEAARRAIPLVAENCRWEHAGQRFFDGRGRTMHQWSDDRNRSVFRGGRCDGRRANPQRKAGRRRVELRGRARFCAVVLRHHDQRTRRAPRARVNDRRISRDPRGPARRTGIPTRASAVPPPEHE